MNRERKFKFTWRHFGTIVAVCMVAMFVFTFIINQNKIENINNKSGENQQINTSKITNDDLPRFESIDELKEVLKNNTYR